METSTLKGQRVAVIGGSSGVGFAVAQCALADGADVLIGSTSAQKVDRAVQQLGIGARGKTVNVKEDASVADFFAWVGSFDHLVFTAGDAGPTLTPKPVSELDLAVAANGFTIRFWGALRAVKQAAPLLRDMGSITLTSGIMSRRPRKGLYVPSAISGAIEHLVQGLAVDLAPKRVNAVCLGFTLTEDHASNMPPEQIERASASQLLKRAGKAEEVAQAYLYALRGSFTTGQILVADGGRTLV